MKPDSIYFFVVIAVTFLISGCSPKYYVPPQPNIPALANGGEGKFGTSFSLPQFGVGGMAFDAQMSYSPIKHLGLTADGMYFSGGNKTNDYSGKGIVGNVGLGYYGMAGERWGADVYAGIGKGSIRMNQDSLKFFSSELMRYYIQPGVFYRTRRFDFGLVFRLSRLLYEDMKYYSQADNDDMLYGEKFLFYEPSLYLALGGNLVKAKFQITPSFKIDNELEFNRQKLVLSFGIDFLIGRNRADKLK